MDDYVTRKDLVELEERLGKRIDTSVARAVDDLSEVIQTFATHVDERFNKLEARVERLEQNFERLQNTLDTFLKRLDDIEKDNAARDAQIARLDRWIHQLADKNGIKLEA